MSAVANRLRIRIPAFSPRAWKPPIRKSSAAIQDELNRQRDKIELIASENIVSKAVLEAQGSVLTNKYAEGYPGKRYYGGCEYVDVTEQLAIERAKQAVRLRPSPTSSPIPAPMPTRRCSMALLQPGRHLHGPGSGGRRPSHPRPSPANYSGKWFKPVPYTRAPRRPAHRHGRGRAPWRASTSPS